MAVDKNKIIAEATRLVQKGALDKAIAAYRKILVADPKDVRVLLKVGELHQRKGDARPAAEAFSKVAETYADQGFFLKSIAVYKQIVRLDPADLQVNERLAALYQQLGLVSDAMGQLQQVAAACERTGDLARLADVLRRMVELDPDNVASTVKLGELHARAGQAPAALECFRRAAVQLKRHGRTDEYLKVAERIAALQPDDLPLTRELAHLHLARGDTKRALAKLQLCFKGDPGDVETLHLLAKAFKDLGQQSKMLSVYKELAHVHGEHGREAEARATWQKVAELSPGDEDAAEALEVSRPIAPSLAAPPPLRPAAPPQRPPPQRPSPQRPPVVAAPPPGAASADLVPKLLTEADVYLKYGLQDRALQHLGKVLAIDPASPDAHERARELHAAAGRPAEAARSGAAAIRALLARGEPERAGRALERLQEIAPDHPEIGELTAAAGVPEEIQLDPVDVEPLEPEPELELEVARAPALAGDDDGLEMVEVEATPEPEAEDEGVALDVAEPEPEVEPEPLAEAAAASRPVSFAAEPLELAEDGRSLGDATGGLAATLASRVDVAEEDLSDDVEVTDFFLAQGLVDEARDALRSLAASHPGHRGVRAKLEALEREGGPADEIAAARPHHETDLAREIAEDLGDIPALDADFQYSVEDVFDQFKKGVEQTVRPEDSATHYDLGIAYREMGLLDDAVHEFETALRGTDRRRDVDCLSMVGACRMAKGEPREAIAAFRRALMSPHLTAEAAKALHFELGDAHQAAGERELALQCFRKVSQLDGAYRQVAGRIAALGAAASPAPAGPHRPARTNGAAAPEAPASAPPRKKNIGYL
jgi:tetratricopeptide (TPR) repeat protein